MLKKLLATCRTVIRGIDVANTSAEQLKLKLEPLIRLTSELELADFGDTSIFRSEGKIINYFSLVEENDFTIGIFILPPGGVIPLHDHPDMFVISRVLAGKLKVTSVDWLSETDREFGSLKGGVGKVSDVQKAEGSSTLVLYPKKLNLHEFRASKDHGCAVLDIIAPKYDDGERPCTYYRLGGAANERLEPMKVTVGQKVYITPTETPGDFQVDAYDLPIIEQGTDF